MRGLRGADTIFDEMFLKQRSDARRSAKTVGEAVAEDFCKLNTLLSIEAFQELYQLQDTETSNC